ncbi:hypothetical protein SAY86_018880 [Trapa natans]|uniref:Uncharacterized protein n=1 Tax=Trapa natans TaxID=22666 RepID=A0AAN7LDG5_TRANT|nr:hypothetical protein SAY86_018880 [Trapa natans]
MELPVKGFVDPPGSALLVVRHRNFGSVCRSIFLMVSSFWIYFYALFLPLFHALHKSSRCEYLEEALTSSIENQEFTVDEREKSSSMNFAHAEAEVIDMVDCSVSGSEIDGLDKRESPEMFLSFKFPPLPEFTRKNLFNDDLELHSRADFSETEVSCCSGNLVQKMEDSMVEIPEDRYTEEGDRVIEEDRFSEAELLIESNSSKILDKVHTNHLQFKFKALSEEDLLLSDSHTDSTSSSHDSSIMSRFLDSSSNGFFSDADFRPCSHTRESNIDDDLREELRKLEEDQNTETPHEEAEEEAPESDSLNPAPELESKDSKMELEWEHQYLMEQLRMEIRKVKATGLPTADEHSVSARVVDDLKSWKIDEKFHRGDQILALHKVYRTYCERMRKLDIFNYQKLYALGFLRAKDPLRWVSGEISSSAPSRASLIAQKLRLCREDKRSRHDPITSFARELHRDLETVYVGQLCLSWELLQLQYERALDQCEEDPYSIHRYTEVADEFQMLQVIMQRFLEDEPFEGPRVQHYVKSRCFQRNLLQVPAIRGDLSLCCHMKLLKSSSFTSFGLMMGLCCILQKIVLR